MQGGKGGKGGWWLLGTASGACGQCDVLHSCRYIQKVYNSCWLFGPEAEAAADAMGRGDEHVEIRFLFNFLLHITVYIYIYYMHICEIYALKLN